MPEALLLRLHPPLDPEPDTLMHIIIDTQKHVQHRRKARRLRQITGEQVCPKNRE